MAELFLLKMKVQMKSESANNSFRKSLGSIKVLTFSEFPCIILHYGIMLGDKKFDLVFINVGKH